LQALIEMTVEDKRKTVAVKNIKLTMNLLKYEINLNYLKPTSNYHFIPRKKIPQKSCRALNFSDRLTFFSQWLANKISSGFDLWLVRPGFQKNWRFVSGKLLL
jgi:hypothetical protein